MLSINSLLKKFCILISGIFIVINFSGCDAVYRLLQKEGAEEKDLIGEIMPYESNPAVEIVQKLLKIYGYKVGNVDGKLGANTRYAIEEFQRDNNLKVTRFIDYATWDQLNIFAESGLVFNGEIDMRTVQRALKNAGFNPGKIDGKRGPRTDKNIQKFQEAMGLRGDGKIGYKTLMELQDFLPEQ